MGKLIKCKACKKEISKKADKCPSCGDPVRRGGFIGSVFKLTVIMFFVGAFTSIALKKDESSVRKRKVASTAKKISKKFDNLFYVKHKSELKRQGITRIKGFYTDEYKPEELKKHCKESYGGFTVCFYYKKNYGMNLVHLSSLKPYDAIKAAVKTDFFARVDISVDGTQVTYSKK